jgi:hypothetical protein
MSWLGIYTICILIASIFQLHHNYFEALIVVFVTLHSFVTLVICAQ